MAEPAFGVREAGTNMFPGDVRGNPGCRGGLAVGNWMVLRMEGEGWGERAVMQEAAGERRWVRASAITERDGMVSWLSAGSASLPGPLHVPEMPTVPLVGPGCPRGVGLCSVESSSRS